MSAGGDDKPKIRLAPPPGVERLAPIGGRPAASREPSPPGTFRGATLSGAAATIGMARLTWKRLRRSKAMWIGLAIAALPIFVAVATRSEGTVSHGRAWEIILGIEQFVLYILSALYVAASLGEEVEDKTYTYLWSRPLPRWSIITGKLLVQAPVVAVLAAGGATLAMQVRINGLPTGQELAGLVAGALAMSCVTSMFGVLWPKHAMSLALSYLMFVDFALSSVPGTVSTITFTKSARVISGADHGSMSSAAIALAVLSALALLIAFWRVKRLE